ncbi:exodeoxyribonuclease I [Veronia pacifica]|uniref:Exodeoxyribonuclease I n=1 Tax=Veronia pacifica TaxID=1080227 RepID=A0A1C3EE45_9GAMM|nr:exodeoxyribonuclease I [Veronia pacifica]ODA31480.1 exodeoxyribonuclease I [Veronia pacifica]
MTNSEQPTFFFFDYETFGTSPALDRPCQFAGVRTDQDFNIIGEPLVIYCQPPNDYLPQPEACLITGITPQTAVSRGLPEPEFIAKIHEQFSVPGTCAVGYNNIRFDDEVTRYTLYRNFFDPYRWSWQNGNSRWDLLDAMRACFALRPDGINWPVDDEGRNSFKLENLSVANGIEHSNAHDAMADVVATIEMAKLMKKAQPRLFDYLYQHRHKNKLTPLIDVVSMKPLVHVSGMFGVDRGNTSWVVPAAWHPDNKNAVIAIDLACDPSPLIDLDSETLRKRLYTKRSELGPDELPVPIKLIHINKCPVLAEAKTLRPEDAARLNIDRQRCLDNLKKIQAHPEIREKLLALYTEANRYESSGNVDTLLYDSFFSTADKSTMEIIRETSPENLAGFELNVSDKRIAPLLFRYRARNFPWTLSDDEQQKWHHHRRDYFEENLPAMMTNLEELAERYQDDSHKLAILKSVYHYVESLVS